jgi:hypothetical protein
MPRFEYCLVEWHGRRRSTERELNRLGREGWQLISTMPSPEPDVPTVMVLSRELA